MTTASVRNSSIELLRIFTIGSVLLGISLDMVLMNQFLMIV